MKWERDSRRANRNWGRIPYDASPDGTLFAITVADNGGALDVPKIYNKALEKGLSGREGEKTIEKRHCNLKFSCPGLVPHKVSKRYLRRISGRGVGMDVVKKALNSLGGLIDIKTKKGEGTSFIIRLPLTLAIIQALLVEVSKEIYAVPLSSVVETLLVKGSDIKTVGGLPMVQLRCNTQPLISL